MSLALASASAAGSSDSNTSLSLSAPGFMRACASGAGSTQVVASCSLMTRLTSSSITNPKVFLGPAHPAIRAINSPVVMTFVPVVIVPLVLCPLCRVRDGSACRSCKFPGAGAVTAAPCGLRPLSDRIIFGIQSLLARSTDTATASLVIQAIQRAIGLVYSALLRRRRGGQMRKARAPPGRRPPPPRLPAFAFRPLLNPALTFRFGIDNMVIHGLFCGAAIASNTLRAKGERVFVHPAEVVGRSQYRSSYSYLERNRHECNQTYRRRGLRGCQHGDLRRNRRRGLSA